MMTEGFACSISPAASKVSCMTHGRGDMSDPGSEQLMG